MKTILNTLSLLLALTITITYSSNAQVTPTAATGGSAISADNVASATYTPLTGPKIAEKNAGNIGTGTIILVPPAGFYFNTTGTTPTVLITGSTITPGFNINNATSGTPAAITSMSAKRITFTVTAASSNGTPNTLTWQNISVIPAAGTPLASGNINDSTASTSTINGVTKGSANTNFGTLTEVAGTPTKLVITPNITTPETAGTAFSVKVQAEDANGNAADVTSTTGITLSFTGSGTLSGNTGTIANGNSSVTLSVTDTKAETVTFTAAATSGMSLATSASSNSVVIKAGALAQLIVSQSIGTQIAGTAFSMGTTSITAEDANGNILNTTNGNDFTGTVTLSTSATYGSVTTPSGSFINGVLSSQSITVTQATSQYITATSGSVTGNSNTFSVNVGAFTQMQIIVPGETPAPGSSTGYIGSPSAATAGTAFTITVNAVDNNWNVVSSAPANTIAITSTDTHANLPASNTLSSGTQTFSFNFETAGSWKITATNSSDGTKAAGVSPSITVHAGALAQLIVSQSIGTQIAGTSFSMGTTSITAEDQYGNILNTTNGNDFTGMVTLSTSAGSVSPTTSSAFVNGVLTSQSITVTDATSQYITATSGSVTGNSNTFTVNAGTATMLAILPISSPQIAGTGFSVTVQAEDADGNAANVNQATVVQLTFSGSGTLSGFTGTIANGTSSIPLTSVSDTKAETVTFGAKKTSGMALSNAATSNSVVINAGTVTKIVFTQQPSAVNQYAVMSPAVTIAAEDANNNINTSYTTTVSLTTTATFAGTATTSVTPVSGVATFSILTFSAAATNKTITGTSGALTVTSGNFTVSAYATAATDYFRSHASANWNVNTTWQSSHDNINWFTASTGSTPDYNSASITLVSPDSVSVTANVEADNIVINSGAQLNINDGITFTINNGSDTDLVVYGILKEIGTGTTGASITLNTGANIAFESGGLYLHDFSSTSTQGNVPIATWDNGSTCEIIGFTSPTTIHVGNLGQSFYNFTWNCPNQTVAYGMGGSLTTVRNNFTMARSGTLAAPQIVYGLGANSGGLTLTIGNDMIISGGWFDFANSAATGTFVLNIGGSYDQTGGTFQSDFAGSGGLTVNFTGTGTFTESAGTLTSTNMNFNVNNGATLTMNNNLSVINSFTVSSGGTLYMGTTTMSGAGSFTLSSGGTLGVGSTYGITTAAAGATAGNIQTTARSFPTTGSYGSYIYDGSGNQNTGNALPSTVAGLVVDNSSVSNLTVTNTGTLTITSFLTLTKGLVVNPSTVLYVTDTVESSVSGYSTSSYVEDSLRRAVHNTGTYDFPVGNSSHYELARLKLNSSSGITYLTGAYNTGLPATLPVYPTSNINSTTVTNMLNSGYWTVTPNTSAVTVNYDITLYENGYTNSGVAASQMGIIKRHNSSDAWHGTNASGGYNGLQGYQNDSTQTIVSGTARAKRTGVEGFSDYGIGYGGTALPIELSSFTAVTCDNSLDALLNWTTSSEQDNNYFDVEVAASSDNNGLQFVSLGQVPGHGTSFVANYYTFTDNTPGKEGVRYYRLKQVNFDGTFSYTDIVPLNFGYSTLAVNNLYPNPTDGILTMQTTSAAAEEVVVSVTNTLGQELYRQTVNLTTGLNNLVYDATQLSAGIYFINIEDNQNNTIHKRFEKIQ